MALSMTQIMAIAEPDGYRCPFCGKYRRLDDFPEQPAHVRVVGPDGRPGTLVSVLPFCGECAGKEGTCRS